VVYMNCGNNLGQHNYFQKTKKQMGKTQILEKAGKSGEGGEL
jgi:hypothetical protein